MINRDFHIIIIISTVIFYYILNKSLKNDNVSKFNKRPLIYSLILPIIMYSYKLNKVKTLSNFNVTNVTNVSNVESSSILDELFSMTSNSSN